MSSLRLSIEPLRDSTDAFGIHGRPSLKARLPATPAHERAVRCLEALGW